MKKQIIITECLIRKRLKELKVKGINNLSKAETEELLELILTRLNII